MLLTKLSHLSAKLPPQHFIGIGGIGMSAIAEVMLALGVPVSGSDVGNVADNYNLARLEKLGAKIYQGHKAEQVPEDAMVIYSSAIKPDNPALEVAIKRGQATRSRAELLANLCREFVTFKVTGTHGKTTTTALLGELLGSAGLSPTIINGGIITKHATNAVLRDSSYWVVEADESDGTMNLLPGLIGVITNIEPEHLDYYGTAQAMEQAYVAYVRGLPLAGAAVVCIDDVTVRRLLPQFNHPHVITYGLSEAAQVRALNIKTVPGGYEFDVSFNVPGYKNSVAKGVKLPVIGEHNIVNSLAALAVAFYLELPVESLSQGFSEFKGVARRFTITGSVGGVTIVDDYAHHPTEIKATLAAARQYAGDKQVIAVWQPHRYSRVGLLLNEFAQAFEDADIALVSEVYAASEKPNPNLTLDAIIEHCRSLSPQKRFEALEKVEDLPYQLARMLEKEAVIIHMGAGTITNWAKALPIQLEALKRTVA